MEKIYIQNSNAMKKNKLKRYSWIHELELDLESMNKEWWVIQSISDIGNRILVIFFKDDTILEDNNIQDDWKAKEEIIWNDTWWAVLSDWVNANDNDDNMVD